MKNIVLLNDTGRQHITKFLGINKEKYSPLLASLNAENKRLITADLGKH